MKTVFNLPTNMLIEGNFLLFTTLKALQFVECRYEITLGKMDS